MVKFFLRCKHVHVRCIHGDEIQSTYRGWRVPALARVRCLDCGRGLYGIPLPDICTVTNEPHPLLRVRGKRMEESPSEQLSKAADTGFTAAYDKMLENQQFEDEVAGHFKHLEDRLGSAVSKIHAQTTPAPTVLVAPKGWTAEDLRDPHAGNPYKIDADAMLEAMKKASNPDKQRRAKEIVEAYILSHFAKDETVPSYEIFVVWFSKTLRNWKALISTTLPDGMYYEVTHNGEMNETYLDAYKKFDNVVISG